MVRYKIVLEYDGTRYYGWQAQKGSRTVQGEFFNVFDKLFPGEKVEFYGAGRTDSGVHALSQTAHLNMEAEMPVKKLVYAMNDLLPPDIHVLKAEKVNRNFHARHDAVARSYVYLISRRRTAFEKAHCWWVRDTLDISVMREVAESMTGFHDFISFTEQSPEEGSTKVQILFIDIHEAGDLIAVHITGSHFLWKMVRRIIGILVEAGRGHLQKKEILDFFGTYSAIPGQNTAPPSGLFLHRVYYQGDEILRGREFMPGLLNI